jgi:hypothetical protein
VVLDGLPVDRLGLREALAAPEDLGVPEAGLVQLPLALDGFLIEGRRVVEAPRLQGSS